MMKKSNKFDAHIMKISFAKKRASELLIDFSPETETAMASLAYAWEMLFDSICRSKDMSIGDLKDVSSIIQRLSSSHKKIKSIEADQVLELISDEREKLQHERDIISSNKLPSDIVKAVEEQLMLL